MRTLHALLLLTLATPGRAQTDGSSPAPGTHSRALSLVHTTGTDRCLATPRPHQAGLVVTPGGTLVAALYRLPERGTRTTDDPSIQLALWSSTDGGAVWRRHAPLPGGIPSQGVALAADPRRESVHVAWSAGEEMSTAQIHYGRFNPATDEWTEAPRVLVPNTKAGEPFLVQDVEVSDDGLVAVAITAWRNPPAPFRSWSSSVLLRAPGAPDFDEPLQINRGGSGIAVDLALQGGVLHASYRSSIPGPQHGIYYRRYDLEGRKWLDENDRPVFPAAPGGGQCANVSSLLVTDQGEVYVLYAHARNRDHGDNCLRVAHLPEGGDPSKRDAWQTFRLVADRGLRGGNHNPLHFALTRGPGSQVRAVYSLISDQHTTLHAQTLDRGAVLGSPRLLARSETREAFRFLSGVGDPRARGLLLGLAAGGPQAYAVAAARWPLPGRLLGGR